MSYLLDTNVVSELRKGARADTGVLTWLATVAGEELYLSTLTVGEIRRGVENVRRRDADGAVSLDSWLARLIDGYRNRIVPVDATIAEQWGRMSVPDPLPVVDGLLAATAKVRGLTLVTRNVGDVARTGVAVVNPFAA